MGKKAPAAPPPPDPVATAQAQSEFNVGAAETNARLNRVNQITPQGRSIWRETQSAAAPVAWDEAGYLAANPDVAASGMGGLTHYQRHGKAEGRAGVPAGYGATPAHTTW